MNEQQAIAILQQLEALRMEIRAHASAVLYGAGLAPDGYSEDIVRQRKDADYSAREASNRNLR